MANSKAFEHDEFVALRNRRQLEEAISMSKAEIFNLAPNL